MSRDLEARNQKVNWQVAPGCHELSNYDDVKIHYRESVEQIVQSHSAKTLKKLTFVTISTNVLCADIDTSTSQRNPHIEPICRDIYYPLEICLTKSCVSESFKARSERLVKTLYFMLDPGKPPANGSVKWSKDHKEKYHKIDYDGFSTKKSNYIERDIKKVVKEINAFLTPQRIVYSTEIRNCRQDLGCLKWLNRELNYTMNPIKVFSLEDLYVVLNRQLYPSQTYFSLGMARLRFETAETYDTNIQCDYHQALVLGDDQALTGYCAKAVAECWTHIILDDIFNFKEIEDDLVASENPDSSAGH